MQKGLQGHASRGFEERHGVGWQVLLAHVMQAKQSLEHGTIALSTQDRFNSVLERVYKQQLGTAIGHSSELNSEWKLSH